MLHLMIAPFLTVARAAWELYTRRFKYFFLLVIGLVFPLELVADLTNANDKVIKSFFPPEQATETAVTTFENITAFYQNVDIVGILSNDPWFIVGLIATLLINVAWLLVIVGVISGVVQTFRMPKREIQWSITKKHYLQYAWPVLATAFIAMVFQFVLLLAFVVPAIIMGVYWSFTAHAVVLAGHKYTNALRHSFQVVRGNWLDVVIRLVILSFGLTVLTMLFTAVTQELFSIPGIEAVVFTVVQIFALYVEVYMTLYFMELYTAWRLKHNDPKMNEIVEKAIAEHLESTESKEDVKKDAEAQKEDVSKGTDSEE